MVDVRIGIHALQGCQRVGWPGYGRSAWQWQPTTDTHDPSPPITLEDAAGATVVEADGASSGAGSVAGVGAAVWAGVHLASAAATTSATGVAVWAIVASADGAGSVEAGGEEILVVRARAQEFSPRYRRGPMVWIDEQGNEVELFFDEGGGRHIRMKPKVKKPYKPVRGIRFRRDA